MKKILFSVALVFGLTQINAQPFTLLEDGFESYEDFIITGIGDWITLDLDGLGTYIGGLPDGATPWPNAYQPMAFQIFNPSVAGVTNVATPVPPDDEVRNFDPHSGLKYAASWAGSPTDVVPRNQDWLISPAITLGTSGNTLSFYAKSLSDTYGLERYRVGVYVGSGVPTDTSDFTIISGFAELQAPYGTWDHKTFALDAYAGQTVRVGIFNVGPDRYMLMIDDVSVTADQLSTVEVEKDDLGIYPSPTRGLVNLKINKGVQYIKVFDASGKLVKENRGTKAIDISEKPAGVYYLNIGFDDSTVVTRKVIKK